MVRSTAPPPRSCGRCRPPSSAETRLPDDLHSIAGESRIAGSDRDAFGKHLRDHHPVERIPMNPRQGSDATQMQEAGYRGLASPGDRLSVSSAAVLRHQLRMPHLGSSAFKILRDVVIVLGHLPEGLLQFIIGWPLGEPARPFRLLSVVRGGDTYPINARGSINAPLEQDSVGLNRR